MQDVQYLLSFILYIVLLVNLGWITIFLFWKTKVRSSAKGKIDGYLLFISLFFCLILIGSIIRLYYMYIYTWGDVNMFFEAFIDPAFRDSHPLYAKMVILYGLFVMYAIAAMTFPVEHYVYKKTRHVLTIAQVIYLSILTPVILILPYTHSITKAVVNFPIIMGIITIMLLVAIYIKVAWGSSGITRKKAIYQTIGFLLFFGGIMFNSQVLMLAFGFYTVDLVWVIGVVFIVAILILFYGSYVKQPD